MNDQRVRQAGAAPKLFVLQLSDRFMSNSFRDVTYAGLLTDYGALC